MGGGTATTVLALVGGITFIALILPIFFDVEFPTSTGLDLADRALCTIFAEDGGNRTCLVPDEIVFFNGTGITITGDDSIKTIFFTVDSNGTITTCTNIGPGEGVCSGPVFSALEFKSLIAGTDINITSDANSLTFDVLSSAGTGENNTGFSLGGDTDVFKNKAGVTLNFRGLTEGAGITLTEGPNDITINATLNLEDLEDVPINCPLDQVIKYNATTAQWECEPDNTGGVDFAVFQAGSGVNQLPASAAPARLTFDGTNYDYFILRYSNTGSQSAIFTYQTPPEFDGTKDVEMKLSYTTEASGGGVCWDMAFTTTATASEWDDPFGTTNTGCNTSLEPVGDLNTQSINFTSAEHGINADDIVIFRLERNTGHASDTNGGNANFVVGKFIWTLQ